MDLLTAEITAVTEKDPAEHYRRQEELFGCPVYERIDAPVFPEQEVFGNLSPDQIPADKLAGEMIEAKLTRVR